MSEKISVDLLEMKRTQNKKKKHTRGPLRFSVHVTEPVTDVVHMVMRLADVSMICPLRDVSELAFLQVSQKSAQFFTAFLVLCGSTSAERQNIQYIYISDTVLVGHEARQWTEPPVRWIFLDIVKFGLGIFLLLSVHSSIR